MTMDFSDLALISLSAILGMCLLIGAQNLWRIQPVPLPVSRATKYPVFLFQDQMLIDATTEAQSLIDHQASHLSDFDAMLAAFAAPFPGLGQRLSKSPSGAESILSEVDQSLCLDVERSGNTLRITLKSIKDSDSDDPLHLLTKDRRQAEIALLRDVSDHAPQMIWQTDLDGRVIWSNQSFLAFAETLQGEGDAGPPTAQVLADMLKPDAEHAADHRRVAVTTGAGDDKHWFDITTVTRDQGPLHFGSDANEIMRADAARRDFVKTLGKTFAQLSTGLAIFDKDRRLAMFNPALLDLTNLPVDFLSTRPSIDTVLDRLRESRMMPEPRDYLTWRDQFAAVEDAAKNGTYSANWALPDGQTIRVIGKPHPDGAFAFLFEDISAELSLTRRFRTEIETGQAVLDSLPEGIAVFSAAGTLVMSNRAYARLWSTKPDLMLEHRELSTEMTIWQERCLPTPMWDEMNIFIHRVDDRKSWSDDAMLDDGRNLRCHATPLTGGTTMVRFTIAPIMQPAIRGLPQQQARIQIGKG